MRGRDLAQRVAAKLDMQRVPEFNGQGPKPTQLARRHRAGEVLRDVAVPADHVDAGRRAGAAAARSRVGARAIRDALLARLSVDAGARQPAGRHDVRRRRIPSSRRAPPTRSPTSTSRKNLALKVQTLEKSAEWLTGEVEKQGKLVQQSELALAQYKEKQDAGALDSSQNIVVARLTQLNEAADQGAHWSASRRKACGGRSRRPARTSNRSRSVLDQPEHPDPARAAQQPAAGAARASPSATARSTRNYQKVAAQLANAERAAARPRSRKARPERQERIRQRGAAGARAAGVS